MDEASALISLLAGEFSIVEIVSERSAQEFAGISKAGTMVHLDAVILRESFPDPKRPRRSRLCPVPRSKFDWAQPLDVPGVKKFVSGGGERAVVGAAISKNARFDDLRRRQMLHAVAGTIVGRKMKDKCIAFKLRTSPHADFGANDLFEITNECGPPSALVAARMHDDVIGLSIDIEIVHCPVRADLGGVVDQNFVIRIFPIAFDWAAPSGR